MESTLEVLTTRNVAWQTWIATPGAESLANRKLQPLF